MNEALLHKEVQDFIRENYKKDLPKLIFQGSPFSEVPVQEIAVQIAGKRKAEKKLPTWFHTEGILYPPTLNLEQTSSETTASYKASFVSGEKLLDLTGGFGIDSYYFATKCSEVIHCELDPDLSEIVAHNYRLLGADNIRTFTGDGVKLLEESGKHYDWIFIDPSRRDDTGGRVFHLSDCLPNVPKHLELLLKSSSRILLKTSPLLDLQSGVLSLQKVQEIHIVAVDNDVKELLWFLGEAAAEQIPIKTINFGKHGVETYMGYFKSIGQVQYGQPLSILYEPNAAIMKSGLFESLGEDHGINKLHPNSHLYTSEELIDFPGRRFRIQEYFRYSKKKLKRFLQIDKAHIATRNFPETAVSLRKQLRLKDGGEVYLFFTTTGKDEKIVLVCEKIK